MCKGMLSKVSAKQPRRLVGSRYALAVLLLFVAYSEAQADACRPETPPPCAADGACYPRRDTWGNYVTRWRPWPGDQIGLAPTPEEERANEIRQRLPVILRPRPDQEELRGPSKKPSMIQPSAEGAPAGSATPAAPTEVAPPAANPEGALPGLNLQGSMMQPLPQVEDGPPALPRSLLQVAVSHLAVHGKQQQAEPQPLTAVANVGQRAAAPMRSNLKVAPAVSALPMNQIELANPAAAHLYQPTEEDLQHAIYYEGTR